MHALNSKHIKKEPNFTIENLANQFNDKSQWQINYKIVTLAVLIIDQTIRVTRP